ncbi:IQ and ubiquitin-like domain-containing protein [Alosa sapidissima]|uniref:IQ and ubiquitin-like domain-containing protein n=1 Tax=Alosa sapidissima TaxID=34773 RepID=UPI001C097E42|nr:IQ and ubiquitin-like domain-containing protein [Alosa sapidissima]
MSAREDEATHPEVTEGDPEGHHESVSENNYATSEVQSESETQTEDALNDIEDAAEVITTNICPTFLTSGETGHVMAEQSSTKAQDYRDVASHVSVTSDLGNSTASVKIMLMPEGHMMTIAFTIGVTTRELKDHFANELKVPSEIIQLSLDGKVVGNDQTLIELGVQPHGTIQLEMTSSDPEKHPIRPVKLQQYNMSDVITVRVQTEADTYQDVVVEIERATRKKPFLGGYRHKITTTEFHHAAVQTMPKRRPDKGVETFSRDTQTVQMKSQTQQCANNTSTQMTKTGCYMSSMEDKLISPGKYVTADEYHSTRLNAVITLQTYFRRWQARRFTNLLRMDREFRRVWLEQDEARKKQQKEDYINAEHHRRMHPQNKEDFALLYNALEKWRKEEMEQIDSSLSGPERKAALCALLEKETQLIASIGRHRIVAGERNQSKAVQAFLDKCAAPKRWRAFDGKVTEMDTQSTLRARELRDLYTSINLQYLCQEERLGVLLTLKHTVKEHDCKLSQDIVELIDRETDLLARGVKEANLEGLRKRISTLFLQYIKNPTFNPQVTKLLRIPQDPASLRKDIYFCRGCNTYLRSTDFALTANARAVGHCRHCSELDNEARHREDFSHYKSILRRVRKAEAEHNPDAKIPYLLQEQDLRYLVDVVWGAQSALSAWSNLHELTLVRWDQLWEWSPWNCILLTKDEATAHLTVDNIDKAYGVAFIRSVKHRHTLARKYFSQIPVMAEYLHDLGSQPAAHSKLLVAKPITTVAKN